MLHGKDRDAMQRQWMRMEWLIEGRLEEMICFIFFVVVVCLYRLFWFYIYKTFRSTESPPIPGTQFPLLVLFYINSVHLLK